MASGVQDEGIEDTDEAGEVEGSGEELNDDVDSGEEMFGETENVLEYPG